MKKLNRYWILLIFLSAACTARTPAVAPMTAIAPTEVIATATMLPATAVPTQAPPSETPQPVATSTPEVTLFPTVTAKEKIVCRMGPEAHYYPVITLPANQSANVQGRSEDGNWVVILSETANKNPTCWLPTKSVDYQGTVNELLVINPPPLPTGPTRAISGKGVCGVNKQGAMVIRWSPVVSGTGYYVYRNGKNIASVYGDSYIDHDTPGSKTPYIFTYTIQGYDSVGMSIQTASVSVTMCK